MEIDEALDAAIPLGRVQYMLVLASMLMNIETGLTTLGNVFLAKIPPHHCSNHSGFTLNESLPIIDGSYARCEEYIDPLTRTDTRPCSNGMIFNTKETGQSVVSDWELVCSRDVLPQLSQSLLLAGFGAGSLVGGPLADKYGRRPTILVSLILFSVIGLSVSLVQSFAVFVTLRFLMGAIFKNKTEKAERTMQKIASLNKAKGFPSPVFAQESTQRTAMLTSTSPDDYPQNSQPRERAVGMQAFTQLLKQPAITVTLVLSWNMITGALTYFGFALTTGSLAGDPYLNFFISSLADLFALIIAVYTIKKIGGLITLISGMAGAAVAMIAIIILPYVTDNENVLGSLLTVFAIVGRFCISLGWQPIILLTSDLFPTSIRNSGTAIVHLVGNVGSLSSPLVIYLNKFYKNLSFMIMVVFCVLSVVFSFLLPETLNTTQPETLEDLQILFDTKRLVRFQRKKEKHRANQQEEVALKEK